MDKTSDVDIGIVGGGPTGLTAALLLEMGGYKVALVAPKAADDGRSVALLQSSLEIFDTIGCRAEIEAAGAALAIMRLVDDTGHLLRGPELAFKASEIGYDSFGYSIATAALTAILENQAAKTGSLRRIASDVEAVQPGVDSVTLITRTAGRVTCRLAVGADGKRSLCREASGVEFKTWSYPQEALVTTVSHERPHDNISTEFHTRAGPFTLVPVSDEQCGLVWVDRPEVIATWKEAEPAILCREIERRSHAILGRITDCVPPRTFPMSGGYAPDPAANRVALVGEAAHYFPPIGAQGLNLGLRDCAALARSLGKRRTDPGEREALQRYVRSRKADVTSRTYGVDMLNRSLLIDFFPVQAARALGLTLADTIQPLRRLMMRLGMAVSPLR
ncbi:MAG: FAD-dependent monooxygenase [Pseudomonadota bacterium]